MGRQSWVRIVGVFAVVAAVVANTSARPTHAATDPLVYVALGDSYTSGPLVLPHDTTWVTQDCGQSTRNYPHLAAPMIGADVFVDVSCGGATIDDFARNQNATLGQPNEPQFDALHKDVDVITVGIGGNDVGFVGLALDCIRLQPVALGGEPDCTPENFENGVDMISRKIQATATELALAIQRMHQLSPRATIFIISYPAALPDDAKACWPYMPIRQSDMTYVVAKFKEMNAMLKATAERSSATYVDIYTSGIGHDACKPPAIAWVNGAVLVPPSFPAHPNSFSFVNSAPVVAQAIKATLAANAKAAVEAATTTTSTVASTPVKVKVLPRTGGLEPLALAAGSVAILGIAARRRYLSSPHSA